MQKRVMGKTGIEVTPLGMGLMRLPTVEGKIYKDGTPEVDADAAVALIREAVDKGVNYLDTAFNYHAGNSEKILGKALQDGYRENVYLATKSPVWLYNEEADFDKLLAKQMERLQTDFIDFYLFHSFNGAFWKRTNRNNAIASMERAKADGRIGFMGFSFHDDLDLFKEILDAADWDFCQIQLNWHDDQFQAGLEGMRLAAQRGMGVVIMEPLRGGELADPPENVARVFAESGDPRSAAEWAFDYLWDMPEVSTVLSGMQTSKIIEDDIAYADRSSAGMLTERDHEVIAAAQAALNDYALVPCTGCNYCVEYCPSKIVIPYNFRAWNYKETDGLEAAEDYYRTKISGFGRDASHCTACGSCEEHCPQHIPISEIMPKIAEELGA